MTQPSNPDSPEAADDNETGFQFNGSIRAVREDDLAVLRPILEEWVRDSQTKELLAGEVDGFLSHMQATSVGTGDRNYVVAETIDGQVTGVMGLAPMGEGLRKYTETGRPIEVVNAFVTDSERGRGAGRALLASLESHAREQGFTELVVTSGPRYREKGWPFWTKVFGQPVAVVKDAFGPGLDGPVWRKVLQT